MPYFLYKMWPDKSLNQIDVFVRYRDARDAARTMRAELKAEDDCTVKVIFAKNPEEAERLLTMEREPRPMGENEY
jgi:hypothetical protein